MNYNQGMEQRIAIFTFILYNLGITEFIEEIPSDVTCVLNASYQCLSKIFISMYYLSGFNFIGIFFITSLNPC